MPPGFTDSGGIDKASFRERGLPLYPPPGDANDLSESSLISDSSVLALRRLVSRTVPQDELLSVIEAIVSKLKAAEIVERLQGDDAQTFADMIAEACHYVVPSLTNRFIDILSNSLPALLRR